MHAHVLSETKGCGEQVWENMLMMQNMHKWIQHKIMNTKTGINESQISKDRQVPKQSHMTLGNLSYGGHQKRNLENLMIQSKWWPCSKSKAGAPAAMLAYVESIVACKVPKQTGRSIERHLAVGRTERCGFHRFPHPEKHRVQSQSTTVHTTFHGSITGWKQEPAAEETHLWILFCEIYK